MTGTPSTSGEKQSHFADAVTAEINPIVFNNVEYINPGYLRIRPGNPRLHTAKNSEAIARAVAATRVMIPLFISAGNFLVTGEGRLAAALSRAMS